MPAQHQMQGLVRPIRAPLVRIRTTARIAARKLVGVSVWVGVSAGRSTDADRPGAAQQAKSSGQAYENSSRAVDACGRTMAVSLPSA